jgi:hypothetical protein
VPDVIQIAVTAPPERFVSDGIRNVVLAVSRGLAAQGHRAQWLRLAVSTAAAAVARPVEKELVREVSTAEPDSVWEFVIGRTECFVEPRHSPSASIWAVQSFDSELQALSAAASESPIHVLDSSVASRTV